MADTVLQDSIDSQATMQLREQIRELAYKLRDAANRIVWLSRDRAPSQTLQLSAGRFESLAFIVGIVITVASFLLVRLFKGLQEARQAGCCSGRSRNCPISSSTTSAIKGSSSSTRGLRLPAVEPRHGRLLGVPPDNTVGHGDGQGLDPLFARDSRIDAALKRGLKGRDRSGNTRRLRPMGRRNAWR